MVAEHILEQASDYLDRIDELTQQEQQELHSWLSQSQEHQDGFKLIAKMLGMTELAVAMVNSEYSQVKQSADILEFDSKHSQIAVNDENSVDESRVQTELEKNKEKVISNHYWMALAASVVFVVTFSVLKPLFSNSFEQNPVVSAKVTSQPVSIKQQTVVLSSAISVKHNKMLNDGTHIYLNASSEVEVNHQPDVRAVNFNRGQAYFDVAKDKTRPFVITSEYAQITVLGTEFDVEKIDNKLLVSVYEGRVEVKADKTVYLTAGQSIEVTDGVTSDIEFDDEQDQLPSWRLGWLEVDSKPISDVIKQLQRYSDKEIIVASAGIDDKLITARFKLNDIDSSLALLAQMSDLKVKVHQQSVHLEAY